jgi:hypothetical protein
MWKYVIYTYLLFWFMVLGIGGLAIFMLNASDFSMRWVITLCSWSPTIVLLLMLKKLNPDTSIWEFYKKAFKEKLDFRVFALVMSVIVGIFLLSVWALSVFENKKFQHSLLLYQPHYLAISCLLPFKVQAAKNLDGEHI